MGKGGGGRSAPARKPLWGKTSGHGNRAGGLFNKRSGGGNRASGHDNRTHSGHENSQNVNQDNKRGSGGGNDKRASGALNNRRFSGGGGKPRHGGGDDTSRFDFEDLIVCLEKLHEQEDKQRQAGKIQGLLIGKAFASFITKKGADDPERMIIKEALKDALPCFSDQQKSRITSKLGEVGITGLSLKQPTKKFGIALNKRLSDKRGSGGASDRKLGGVSKLALRGRGGKLTAREKDRIKAAQPWNEKDEATGRTGANTIEVDWVAPADKDKVEGVTAKSAPPRPPSPVQGPVGRGRATSKPAWMTKADNAAPPALTDGSVDTTDAPAKGPVGRGRSNTKPAWMTGGSSEPPPPSIPDQAIEDRRSPSPDLHDFLAETREGESRRETDDKGKGRHKGRSRSGRRKGKGKGGREDRKGHRDSGHDRQSERTKEKDSWNKDEKLWDQDSKWTGDAKSQGRWQHDRSEVEIKVNLDILECAIHGKKRNWDALMEGAQGAHICRPGFECVIYIGGSRGSKVIEAALQQRREQKAVARTDDMAALEDSEQKHDSPHHSRPRQEDRKQSTWPQALEDREQKHDPPHHSGPRVVSPPRLEDRKRSSWPPALEDREQKHDSTHRSRPRQEDRKQSTLTWPPALGVRGNNKNQPPRDASRERHIDGRDRPNEQEAEADRSDRDRDERGERGRNDRTATGGGRMLGAALGAAAIDASTTRATAKSNPPPPPPPKGSNARETRSPERGQRSPGRGQRSPERGHRSRGGNAAREARSPERGGRSPHRQRDGKDYREPERDRREHQSTHGERGRRDQPPSRSQQPPQPPPAYPPPVYPPMAVHGYSPPGYPPMVPGYALPQMQMFPPPQQMQVPPVHQPPVNIEDL